MYRDFKWRELGRAGDVSAWGVSMGGSFHFLLYLSKRSILELFFPLLSRVSRLGQEAFEYVLSPLFLVLRGRSFRSLILDCLVCFPMAATHPACTDE